MKLPERAGSRSLALNQYLMNQNHTTKYKQTGYAWNFINVYLITVLMPMDTSPWLT